jgi:xanthine dehydrogenase YagR molybdenum-binding subunit
MNAIGSPITRVDGPAKVSGGAIYSADVKLDNLAYACIATSTISKGRVASIDDAAARAVPGVLRVITAASIPALTAPVPKPDAMGQTRLPLQDDQIDHFGQPIALVIALTRQSAEHACGLLRVTYQGAGPAHLSAAVVASVPVLDPAHNVSWSAAAAAASAGAVEVEQTYSTPYEHHCPIELPTSTAVWNGDELTIYDCTQWLSGVRTVLAACLNHPAEKIRVISRFVGGSFGSKRLTWAHPILAAAAARSVQRPVSVFVSRRQSFATMGHRPNTQQKLRLTASQDGKLVSFHHEATTTTSRADGFVEAATSKTRMIYASPNGETARRQTVLDIPTPTAMRAPGEATGFFALECAMDELAYRLNMDPIAFRLLNYADVDPVTGKQWSSNSLRQCYDAGSQAFGWSDRPLAPRSMSEDGDFVGWGMASAAYPVNRSPASALVSIDAHGRVDAASATHEMGSGTYTAMTQIVADSLGIDAASVFFALGDTRLPRTTVSGGSRTLASVGSALVAAAADLLEQAIAIAVVDPHSPLKGAQPSDISAAGGYLSCPDNPVVRDKIQDIVARSGQASLTGRASVSPPSADAFSRLSFGAHFVEVRVDKDFGLVRVTRAVSAFGAGRIINPLIARSQLAGGIVQGIGMALLEDNAINAVNGSFFNASLSEYLVPVCADIPKIEIFTVAEFDPGANPLGSKGVGELGIVGAASAVANAVFHATGVRVRDLPIRPDKLLSAL